MSETMDCESVSSVEKAYEALESFDACEIGFTKVQDALLEVGVDESIPEDKLEDIFLGLKQASMTSIKDEIDSEMISLFISDILHQMRNPR